MFTNGCNATPIDVPAGQLDAIARMVRRRLLPGLFLLYVTAYLDRINVGFAALTMNRELGITSEQYGLLSGVFFWGYFLFEVPSNLLLERFGARVWIARILVSWGVVSLLTAFATGAWQLYVARFALGVAEAGFFPGVLLYLRRWFRDADLPEAIGLFMTALPAASLVGGPVSGWILDHVHAGGLSSWRWVLILEAIPAVVGGVLTYRYLPELPVDATFLTAAEKQALARALEADPAADARTIRRAVVGTMRHPRILHLAAVAFLFMVGLYTTGFWMPQAIRAVVGLVDHGTIGLLVMVPNLAGLLAMTWISRRSSRTGERHAHAAGSLLVAVVGFSLLGSTPSPAASLALWCLCTAGLCGFIGPFWALPGQRLTGTQAATALATVCSIGNLGGFFGLAAIGALTSRGGTLAVGFRLVALSLALGALLLVLDQPFTRRRRVRLSALAAPADAAVRPRATRSP